MKTLLTVFILFLTFACKTDAPNSEKALAVNTDPQYPLEESEFKKQTENDYKIKNTSHEQPYSVKFDMAQVGVDKYDFIVRMELQEGAHFVSPNAKRDFKGKFTMLFDENEQLEKVSDILEIPRSVEEVDPHPFVNGTVNWVRENTRYEQRLLRTSNDDFHVKGIIQFTIEPRCTLEKVPFIIKYENGEMRAEFFGC
ncbi:MAG: hypothetical protein AAF466_01115 [Bacteroidota bacterium]